VFVAAIFRLPLAETEPCFYLLNLGFPCLASICSFGLAKASLRLLTALFSLIHSLTPPGPGEAPI
jgi:hypothetical protein